MLQEGDGHCNSSLVKAPTDIKERIVLSRSISHKSADVEK